MTSSACKQLLRQSSTHYFFSCYLHTHTHSLVWLKRRTFVWDSFQVSSSIKTNSTKEKNQAEKCTWRESKLTLKRMIVSFVICVRRVRTSSTTASQNREPQWPFRMLPELWRWRGNGYDLRHARQCFFKCGQRVWGWGRPALNGMSCSVRRKRTARRCPVLPAQ